MCRSPTAGFHVLNIHGEAVKSFADSSIIARTPSVVHFAPIRAVPVPTVEALAGIPVSVEQDAYTSREPLVSEWCGRLSSSKTKYIHRDVRMMAKLPRGPYLRPAGWLLAVDIHVVGDHRALLVVLRLDLGDREARVTKFREGLL